MIFIFFKTVRATKVNERKQTQKNSLSGGATLRRCGSGHQEIKTVTGPHVADSRDGKEIEYYWFEAYKKGHGNDWISTEVCDVYSCGATAAQEGALEESCEATCEATQIDDIETPSIEARVAAATSVATKENEGVLAVVDAASAVVAASDASPAPQVEGAAAAPAGGSSSEENEGVPAVVDADVQLCCEGWRSLESEHRPLTA